MKSRHFLTKTSINISRKKKRQKEKKRKKETKQRNKFSAKKSSTVAATVDNERQQKRRNQGKEKEFATIRGCHFCGAGVAAVFDFSIPLSHSLSHTHSLLPPLSQASLSPLRPRRELNLTVGESWGKIQPQDEVEPMKPRVGRRKVWQTPEGRLWIKQWDCCCCCIKRSEKHNRRETEGRNWKLSLTLIRKEDRRDRKKETRKRERKKQRNKKASRWRSSVSISIWDCSVVDVAVALSRHHGASRQERHALWRRRTDLLLLLHRRQWFRKYK